MIAAGIEYADAGKGGVPIVCLHGIGGDTQSFRPQLDGLSGTQRMIAWAMPGYGASDPLPELTFAALAARLIAFLDCLGVARAHLCGQSIGGMLAIEVACRAPERVASLALIGTTSAFGGRDDSFKDAFLAARLTPLDAGQSMPELAERFVPEITGPIATDAAKHAAIGSMSRVSEATYRGVLRCLTTFDRRAELPGLAHRTALIAGSHDQNAPAKTMARMAVKMPQAEYHLIEGAGHLINLEAPQETNRILRAFYGGEE